MRRTRQVALILLVLAVLATEQHAVQAQQPFDRYNRFNPVLDRPVVSPYLNLMRRDASPAANYFTLVRPQIQAQAALGNQANRIQNLQQELNSVQNQQVPTGVRATGHATHFGNYSHFYPSMPGSTRR